MEPSADAIALEQASIEIEAPPDVVYALISDIERMGDWSPEAVGGRWLYGGDGRAGDWFEGHNRSGDREWTRPCEVAEAEPGRGFTFVVGGVEANRTWWSYELQPTTTGTKLTERWWVVNKSPALQAMTAEQFSERVEFTRTMLKATIEAVKRTAEAPPSDD